MHLPLPHLEVQQKANCPLAKQQHLGHDTTTTSNLTARHLWQHRHMARRAKTVPILRSPVPKQVPQVLTAYVPPPYSIPGMEGLSRSMSTAFQKLEGPSWKLTYHFTEVRYVWKRWFSELPDLGFPGLVRPMSQRGCNNCWQPLKLRTLESWNPRWHEVPGGLEKQGGLCIYV